jgi:mono/diheme cytochrome c family protein
MDGFVIKSTEGRIMLGITMFVAVMILVGWIAINEPARMASFEEQHLGRSIERGAELFAASCSTCHGVDGRGVPGNGPGLNNPHLFGYDFLAVVNDPIIRAQREINDLEALESPTEENLARLKELDVLLNGDGNTQGLLAQRDELISQMGSASLKGYLPKLARLQADLEAGNITALGFSQQIAIDANRLAQVSWGGSLEGYMITTLIHGRPGSNNVWPNAMVSWSQRGGGPLRDDQIQDIVNYILNFDKGANWTLDDLNGVNQFARLHAQDTGPVAAAGNEGGSGPSALGPEDCSISGDCVAGVGTVAEIAAALPEGDTANGNTLYTQLGCIGCHLGGAVGPDIIGTWARVESERLPAQEGEWTAEEFVVGSILYPNHYVPTPYPASVMPPTFGQQLTLEQLGDIVAYIRAQ